MNFRREMAVGGLCAMLGGIVVAALLIPAARRQSQDFLVSSLESDLLALEALRRGEFEALIGGKEQKLKTYARILNADLADHPGTEFFLWRIRNYYQMNDLEIPAESTAGFAGLPTDKPTPSRIYHSQPGDVFSFSGFLSRLSVGKSPQSSDLVDEGR